jgi:hypothetical protein
MPIFNASFNIASLSLAISSCFAATSDFQKLAVPFMEKHCYECHGGKETKGDLDLKAFKDDSKMLQNRKVWLDVVKQTISGEMPPKKKTTRPSAADVAAFNGTVSALLEKAESTAKPDPGMVTVRRLNRTEYNNTVRDLLLVDFDAAEDFPTDDIGHGFDNMGDVLTLSPLLMERYLNAAETIAQRVILDIPPKPSSRRLSGRYLQPNNSTTPQGRFRTMDPASKVAVESGPFLASGDYLKFTGKGELFFRSTLYAETTGTAPVKVVLFIQGKDLKETSTDAEIELLMGETLPAMKPLKILKTFEITARTAAKPETIEVPINRISGITRAGIAVIKPPDGEEPPKLFIESLWSEGPMDTRPDSQIMILACTPGKPQAEQTREVLTRLVTRAFRRPAKKTEVEALSKIVDQSVASGRTWEGSIKQVLPAILSSPKFIYRIETDEQPSAAEPHPISEFALASRLSYFLWSTMPDAELFALAEKKQLVKNLPAQVKRMLADARAESLVQNFAMQWLQLKRLATSAPDAQMFPEFNEPLRRAMLRETELFFTEMIREDRSVLELVDANFTYLNAPLAKFYGILDTVGNPVGVKPKEKLPGGAQFKAEEFARVSLPAGQRGGLLTQASILTVTSNPTRTSPVKRGKWVLEQLLGTPPPDAPPNVAPLDEQKQLTGTLRQRMEQHRANPNCASCHLKMDALGFAFENYDAIGRFRLKDGDADIDASGTLPDGKTFNGPAELKEILKGRSDLIARNITEKLLTYAVGRGLEYYDERSVKRIVSEMSKVDYKFSVLVGAIVNSDPFRLQRGTQLNALQSKRD